MRDCRQAQHHLESLPEGWENNEPTSDRNKKKRQETQGAIQCLKDMQQCGLGHVFSEWDCAVNAASSSGKTSGDRMEHSERHKEYPANRSRGTKSRRSSQPPGLSGIDTSRTTHGRPPEPKHLRYQETGHGQIYGKSLFGWLRRTWRAQWLY